jgi:hypothetical protein
LLTKIQYNEKIFDKREFLLNGMENKKNRPNLLEVSRTPLGEAINKLERDWWKLFLKRGLL